MRKIVETPRLLLREFNLTDAQCMYELNLNPNVVQYTGDKAFENIAEARQFLKNYNDYKENGFGRWAVIAKDTNKFVGWCGLKLDKQTQLIDIGFRFYEEEWGKGYATESAKACLRLGFETLKLNSIIGRAMKENLASIQVLNKIGLQYETDIIMDYKAAVLYKIEQ